MQIDSQAEVYIIGGGLAGSEAAWQLAKQGYRVKLFEMRPQASTEAHQTSHLAELVCSNSFRSADPHNAVGLLKEEMRQLGSLIMRGADQNAIPGGGALVMDREGFATWVTRQISNHPLISLIREEVRRIPQAPWVLLATGPLTSSSLAQEIAARTGQEYLYFYDSIAPIITAESINFDVAFRASRYDKGTADYLNCPLNREQYEALVAALASAEKIPHKEFDQPKYFEGCLPVEVMAERGRDALAFGPLKPVGLTDPRTGKRPHAVVQLRQDDLHGTLYNMVGFQTRMKYPEQLRIFRKIPGLETAEFVRLGSMHRNTFINSPELLTKELELKGHPGLFLAGQMIGVEGYVESAAMGLYAGLVLSHRLRGKQLRPPSPQTALGALVRHITQANPKGFQPMNVNFGLFDLPPGLQKKRMRPQVARQAIEEMGCYQKELLHATG